MQKRIYRKLPDLKRLHQLFFYDPQDGRVYNLTSSLSRKKGAEAESISLGYRTLFVDGLIYRAHRIIYKMIYNIEPSLIDHVDRDKLNNRIENLREVSESLNVFNVDDSRYPSEFPRGIRKHGNKFRARISYQRKRIHLGCFETLEEAVDAYKQKGQELYGSNH